MNQIVIIPALEPDEKIIELVEELDRNEIRILVIDDGSDEQYQSLFEKLSKWATVLHHETNKGKGAALKTAMNYIKKHCEECDLIGVMDADGQHLVSDMQKLFVRLANRRDSFVLGVREIGKDMPLRSRFGNAVTRTVFHMLSGVRVSDTQTGLRAFSGDLIPFLEEIPGDRYEYEINVLLQVTRQRIPIEEVPIRTIYRDEENSTSHFHPIRDSFKVYKEMFKFAFSSLSSFVLDYVLFSLLVFLFPGTRLWTLTANVLARLVSGFYNYHMNSRFVFRTKKSARTGFQYFCLALFILVANNVILSFYLDTFSISVNAAKIMTESSLFVISFLVQKKVIYRRKKVKGCVAYE